MGEGRVWRCKWKQEGTRWVRVWVEKHPRVATSAATFEEADHALWELILQKFGDGENARDYDPPPPRQGPGVPLVAAHDLVEVSPNARAYIEGEPSRLFDRTTCSFCAAPRGNRSSLPLVVRSFDREVEGASTATVPYPTPPYLKFVSEKFLAILSPAERRGFEWRPVTSAKGRTGTRYYEAIPKRFVPYVPVKGLHGPLITCDHCRRPRSMAFIPRGGGMWHFVCDRDLPRPLPGLFAAGAPERYALCMPRRRWEVFRRSPGARGWVSGNLGAVSEATVAKRPPRKLLSIQRSAEERFIRKMGLDSED